MMCEREYFESAATWVGGRLTELKAKALWAQWRLASGGPLEGFPPHDEDGPEESRYSLWVKTATEIHFQEM
eukprot:11183423-Lingulodinium_polyedra.AAC.1